jgi:hypothetical protein
MRVSSRFVAPSAVAILSTALLCGPSSTAVSQTTPGPGTSLPSVTVVAPRQAARPHRPARAANTTATRRTLSAIQTQAPSAAPNSTLAKFAQLERTSSNCSDGCQTSFKHGNAPWNGCSASSGVFSPTCRNVRNFKSYFECRDYGRFLGWRDNEVWGYCTSLAAGDKFNVAELKPPGRQR